MSQPIVFISRNRIKPGKLAAFRDFFQRGVGAIEADKPGTVVFLAYLNGDASEVSIVHLFLDADAMDRHMEGAGERAKQAYEFIESAGFEIYGTPGDGVLAMMKQIAGTGVALTVNSQYVGGFTRLRPASTPSP